MFQRLSQNYILTKPETYQIAVSPYLPAFSTFQPCVLRPKYILLNIRSSGRLSNIGNKIVLTDQEISYHIPETLVIALRTMKEALSNFYVLLLPYEDCSEAVSISLTLLQRPLFDFAWIVFNVLLLSLVSS